MKYFVVIPARNEEKYLENTIVAFKKKYHQAKLF